MSAPAPKILLLDDEPNSSAAVRGELEAAGWLIIEAENYVSAIGLLYAHTDLRAAVAHMNTRRGRAGAEFMVEVERLHPNARRVLYSRWGAAEADAREFAHEFMTFPWEAGKLMETLRRLLNPE
jgi:DNA-binding NtrC family response regulator